MASETHLTFRGLPGMLANYVKVVAGKKPMIAPDTSRMGRTVIVADRVRIGRAHLDRYRNVCGIPEGKNIPHAFPHVLAMPLHMCVFTSAHFPVKVLGLIHLRNTIRYLEPIVPESALTFRVECDTMRETKSGQEFDLITRAEVNGNLAWEEISTMLAHRATPGQRPTIERAGASDVKTTLAISGDTGRRYAHVSGDYNPIHLSKRTASWFGFKQAVAHGMWSMSRSLGEATSQLPSLPVQVDTQFKLPLYLPSDVIYRAQKDSAQTVISLSSAKGDRMHLATQVKPV